jgi:hypothetical protein
MPQTAQAFAEPVIGLELEAIIDLDRYPIHQPESPLTLALVAQCRAELDAVGCCCVRGFIRPESIGRMLAEAERLKWQTHWSENANNPYMTKDDPSLPEDHPKRIFNKRNNGFINSDLLEADSDLRGAYDSDEMLRFVSDCLGVAPIYRWADPLGRNPYSVMDPGQEFAWHFDGNEFTISILVQGAETGGMFEYCPDLRSSENENFGAVTKVLRGDRGPVLELDLQPGDLQIFKGRFSMHRVTEVEGSRTRYIALPTYVLDPFSVNRPERAKQFYGRAEPIHYEREAQRPDRLLD